MKIFMAGQKVPSWLEKVEPDGKGPFNDNYIFKFTNPTVVYVKNDQYHVRSIVGEDSVMTIENMTHAIVTGQPVKFGGRGVIINTKPIIRWSQLWLIGMFSLVLLIH